MVPILSCESPGNRVPYLLNKEAQGTGDKILSRIATLIQSSPAVNWGVRLPVPGKLLTTQ